jgi:hypothetical protein
VGRSLSRSSANSLPREGSERATNTSHTLEEVETMVHCIISLYESKVRAKLFTFCLVPWILTLAFFADCNLSSLLSAGFVGGTAGAGCVLTTCRSECAPSIHERCSC